MRISPLWPRADASPHDIAAIFALLGPAFEMSRSNTPELWRRYLALILDGLRATDRPALPAPPAAGRGTPDHPAGRQARRHLKAPLTRRRHGSPRR